MPPVRSRSTYYRSLKNIRKENEDILRRMTKIKNSLQSASCNISPGSSKTAESSSAFSQEEALRVIFSMVTKHGLQKSFLPDLLELIRSLSGNEDVAAADYLHSTYKLMKAMTEEREKHSDIATDVVFHHFCEKCEKLFGEEDVCTFCGHSKYNGDGKPRSVFMEINPATQIQDFFRDKSFVEGIKYRFQRIHRADEISDIYDGERYKALFQNGGILSKKNNLSLIWHTDGVSIFKSSNMQVWPVQSTVCELPPNIRFSKKYVLLHGLWFGEHKPTMTTFLSPIIATMNKLRSEGIEVTPYSSSHAEICKVTPLAATMDLPAAAAVKEIHQWNGSHGCTMCEEEGVSVTTGKRGGHCRVYTYPRQLVNRTDERMFSQVEENLQSGDVTQGVKGYSTLFQLDGFGVAESVMIDYLHGVCLGVMKRVLKAWLQKKGEDFYIGNVTEIINERLAAIKTPAQIHRPPRSLENMVHYKASEYRNWLLYYGLYVTDGILPDEYRVHFAMLSRAMYILLSDSITKKELSVARELLGKWYFLLESYYGADECTVNAHNAGMHLVRCVELCGPLWAFSCFFFESVCGDLARMVHGTQEVPKQILSGIRMRQFLNRTGDFSTNPVVNKLTKNDKRKLVPLSNGFSRIGKCVKWTKPANEVTAVVQLHSTYAAASGVKFFKVERKGIVYHTDKQLKNRANHYVVFKQGSSVKCGIIDSFLSIGEDSQPVHLCLLRNQHLDDSTLLDSASDSILADHLVHRGSLLANYKSMRSCSADLLAVPIAHLLEPYIFLPMGENGQCVFMPTTFEHD